MTAASERWRAVRDDLRAAIRGGTYLPGERLPSVDELMARYQMNSRPAMQKVLAALVADGLIRTVHRIGSFVREYTLVDWYPGTPVDGSLTASHDSWAANSTTGGRPRQQITVECIAAPSEIAQRLEVEPGSEIIVRWRRRVVDETPFQTADSYHRPAMDRDAPDGEAGASIAHSGLSVPIRYRDEITARMPHPRETERLALPPGTPVAEHIRTSYDAEGRPIEVIVTIVPGDRQRIVYEVTAH